MIDDYEDIMNMTDEEAAEILENTRIRMMGGRMNGKTRLSMSYNVALQKAIIALKSTWVPIKYRPLTEEERIALAEYCGIEYCDTEDEKAFDCPMPEDGQEILVSASWGVSADVADNDIDGEGFIYYGLEGNGDWEGIDAWMPKPEPYKEKENDNK